jgi:hypothetical protein
LSITHELRQAKAESLPDVVLDNIPHYAWALGMMPMGIQRCVSVQQGAETFGRSRNKFRLRRRLLVRQNQFIKS